jgi:hypothetical protein
MKVLFVMAVPMRVRAITAMAVKMTVRTIAITSPQSPDKISQAKAYKQPGCYITPQRFSQLKILNRKAERHPY